MLNELYNIFNAWQIKNHVRYDYYYYDYYYYCNKGVFLTREMIYSLGIDDVIARVDSDDVSW